MSRRESTLLSMVVALALGLAGCGGDRLPLSSARQGEPTAAQSALPPELTERRAYPPRIVTELGTMDTTLYHAIPRRSTTDRPYGPQPGGGSLEGMPSPIHVARRSGAVVLVEVLSISNPHFNSDDGGFWIHPEGGVDGAPIQDVRLRVLERWGDHLGLPETFDIVTVGGSIEFFLDEQQARAARYEKAGRYIMGVESDDDLTVGERPLLFIGRNVVGWKGGGRPALMISYGYQGKFSVVGDRVENKIKTEWSGPAARFREDVARNLGADCPGGPAAGRCATGPVKG